eukprot:4548678-Pyramimonas_sp.AAC.1
MLTTKTFRQKEGLKAAITPAVPSGKSHNGLSAGEVIATRTHIRATSLDHWKGKSGKCDRQGDA